MRDLIDFVLHVIVAACVIAGGTWLTAYHNNTIIYRCNGIETEPDVPPQVKEECKKRILHGSI